MDDFRVCCLRQSSWIKVSGIGTAFSHQRKALEKAGIQCTTSPKDDFDILHLNFVGPKSYLLAKKFKRKGKKIVMHTHTTAEDAMNSFRMMNLSGSLIRKYLTGFYSMADLLISPSEHTKNLLEKKYSLSNKILFISNGVDFEKFRSISHLREEYRKRYGLEGDVVFTVGHVFRRKGLPSMINAAKKMPNSRFAWFGPLYNPLISGAGKLIQKKPENLVFTGFVEDIRGAYAAGDIFFFPSHAENQGIAILEAAASKHPLVVRNLPTYRGWLLHKKNALIGKNSREFCEHIRILQEDHNLRKKIAGNAFEMAKKHDLKIIGEQLRKAYLSIL